MSRPDLDLQVGWLRTPSFSDGNLPTEKTLPWGSPESLPRASDNINASMDGVLRCRCWVMGLFTLVGCRKPMVSKRLPPKMRKIVSQRWKYNTNRFETTNWFRDVHTFWIGFGSLLGRPYRPWGVYVPCPSFSFSLVGLGVICFNCGPFPRIQCLEPHLPRMVTITDIDMVRALKKLTSVIALKMKSPHLKMLWSLFIVKEGRNSWTIFSRNYPYPNYPKSSLRSSNHIILQWPPLTSIVAYYPYY